MRKILATWIFALFAFLPLGHALAQSSAPVVLPNGCGTGNATNSLSYLTVDSTLKLCVNATVTVPPVTVGGFTPSLGYATLTAAASSGSSALPSNSGVVAFQNTGSATVSCTLGIGSATALANEIQVPASSTVFVTVGSNTFGACIDQTGSTSNLVVLAGGSGLGTGFGGGGGGGGGSGGNVTIVGPLGQALAAASVPVILPAATISTLTPPTSVAVNNLPATQPISAASGAVNAGAFAVGAVPNGGITAQGSTTDTPCTLPASATACSQVAIEKAIANQAAGANPVNVNGTVTAQTGVTPGVAQTGTKVAANQDVTSVGGTAVPKGGVPVINGGNTYNTVAASQTAQALTGGSGGATGDYLSHCVVQPTTTAAGTVTILDNATVIFTFTTGTLSNLVPFAIPVGANSVSGAWKISTGANETVTCVGKFS